MRFRTVVGVLVGAYAMLVLAKPAAAQVKVDFSGGYQYFNLLAEGSGDSIPAGWGASIGVGNAWIKAVGDVAGHYKNGGALHTFQGGVEFSGKGKRVVPFGRILTGVASFSYDDGDGFSFFDSAYVLTPEFGVKIMANDRVGAQVSVGFPILMDQGETETTLRFFAGIVIRK